MYLRESRQKRADGTSLVHLQFAESQWNAEKGRSETKIVYNWGRADDPEVVERLRRLAKSIPAARLARGDCGRVRGLEGR
jgi:hypothetical protein